MKRKRLRDIITRLVLKVLRPVTKLTPTGIDDEAVKQAPKARLWLRVKANKAAKREKLRKAGLLVGVLSLTLLGSGCATLDKGWIWLDQQCPEASDLPAAEWDDTNANEGK